MSLFATPKARVKLTEMSFTPLIDCVFLLLLFFMVGMKFRELDRELPWRLAQRGPEPPFIVRTVDELHVAIRNAGTATEPRPQVSISRRAMRDWDAARAFLGDYAAAPGGRDVHVIVAPTDDAAHGWVVKALGILNELGYQKVSFKH